MKTQEIWRPVVGYEGLYEVSNLGRVKSIGNDKSRKEKILKPKKEKNGYLHLNLCKEGNRKAYSVHRIVAIAFIPNPDNLPEVNHKDENKENNFVWVNDETIDLEKSNLEWVSHIKNSNHGTRNKRIGEKHSKRVAQYTLGGELVAIYPSTREAARQTGFYNGIGTCCLGKQKTAYGYIWRYID